MGPRRKTRRARSGDRPAYRITGGVLLALAATVILLTVVLVQRWERAAGPAAAPDADGGGPDAVSQFSATMFYVTEDGLGLVRREVDIAGDAGTLARARAVVERQLAEAPEPLRSPFPEGTRLRALYLADDGHLFVDLSEEVSSGHSGGSLDELFTVYTLVNALTTSVPEVTAVQILVDGREADTLAGHVDLRQPLAPNLTWVVDLAEPPPDEEEAAPGDDGEPPAEGSRSAEGVREPAAPATGASAP